MKTHSESEPITTSEHSVSHGVSRCLFDKRNNKEVRSWYVDMEGNPYIDLDPCGIDMSGTRTIKPAIEKFYEFRNDH